MIHCNVHFKNHLIIRLLTDYEKNYLLTGDFFISFYKL